MARPFQLPLALTVLFFVSLTSAQSYQVVDLGEASGGGRGINSKGDVVADTGILAFYSSPTLGHFALEPLISGGETQAAGVNTRGIIVGESLAVSNNRAVLWVYGHVKDLGVLPGGVESWGGAINDAGAVAGTSDATNTGPQAFLWTEQQGIKGLGFLGGGNYSTAFGINSSDVVVGFSDLANGAAYAFAWSSSTGMQNLGALPGGGGSSANAVNNLGQIAGGSSTATTSSLAVLWNNSDSKPQDLGLLPGTSFSSAYGINNAGQVVGSAGYIQGADHAFVWSGTSGLQDLNNLIPANSGWLLNFAFAINDSGEITGQGTINGQTHAFLLIPTD